MPNIQARQGLQFNVAQLLKEATGASRRYKIETPPLGPLGQDISLVSPLMGEVKFLRAGPNILVTGALKANVEIACGRCLTIFTAAAEIELEEEFYPSIDVITAAVLPPARRC